MSTTPSLLWLTVRRLLVAVSLSFLLQVGLPGCETNSPPVLRSLQSQQECVRAGSHCRLMVIASDPDDDMLTYTWQADGGTIAGSGPVVTWNAPDKSGSYRIVVVVSDGRGGEAEEEIQVAVSQEPVIESLTATPTRVDTGGTSTLECEAYDPEGDELSYNWSASAGSISGDGHRVEWAPPPEGGKFVIRVTVADESKGEASKHITVEANRPPIVQSLKTGRPAGGACTVRPGTTNTVTCTAIDLDGDDLTYTWSASAGSLSGSGPEVAWTAPDKEATYTITVVVSDGRGGEAVRDVDVKVEESG
ncbi:MAG: Ig-like domain-containing protein [Chloroflexota bacterium]